MVLESLINPFEAERHLVFLFLLGIVYASLGLVLGYWVFPEHASIVMITFVVLAALPLFYHTMKYVEHNLLASKKESDALHAHAKVLTFLIIFFLGLTIAFTLWHVVLPDHVSAQVFRVQESTIITLNQQVTGNVAQLDLFSRIFLNNIKVLVFSLFFSFIYGTGALFILTWNSSVIGAAMGKFIDTYVKQTTSGIGGPLTLYFFGGGLSILRYFIHGIPEILAYFVGGLVGGILSVALIRGDIKTYFNKITTDTSDLLIIAVVLLVIAGLLEVYVTPAFFA